MSETDVCFYFSQLRLNQFLYFQVLEQQGIIRVESNAWLSGNTIFLCSVFLLISEDSVQPISLEAHSRLPALGSSEQALADRPPPRATSMQPDCCIAVGMQVLSLVRENGRADPRAAMELALGFVSICELQLVVLGPRLWM